MWSARYLAPVFLGAILTFAVADLRPAMAQESIGRTRVVVQTVTGETDVVRRRLAVRDNVFREELIRTELDSASVIRFVDRTRLTLGPNARLILDKAVFDPTPGRGSFVLSAVQGVFRFLSGGLDSSAYEIRTPTVSIGVRGTMFAGVVAPDGTTVVILQSPDEVTVRHRTSGERVTLVSHGDSTTAYPDGVLTEPGPAPGWARALLLEMDHLLRIDPIHIERDNLEDEPLVIEASAAPAVSPTPPMGAPPETPTNDQVSEPTPIVAPDKLPPASEPPEPPLTVSQARALERARTVAAGPAQTGGLARADDHADERAEGSRDHGSGDRDGSQAGGESSGRSETASASAGPSQSNDGGQGSNADDGQTTSRDDDNDSNGTSRGARSDRGGKGDGKGSGGKGKNRR